jgi:hypothetical protein
MGKVLGVSNSATLRSIFCESGHVIALVMSKPYELFDFLALSEFRKIVEI